MIDFPKILIIRLSSIGDIVLTSPFVRSVRKLFPDSIIDFAVKEQFVSLVSSNPNLNNVLAFETHGGFKSLHKFSNLIRNEKYDLVIDLHKNLRSLYLRNNSGAQKVVKYRKDIFKRFLLVKTGLNLLGDSVPVWKRYFRALESFDCEPDEKYTELFIPREVNIKVYSELKVIGLDKERKLVVLCPGAGFPTKRWIPEGFAAVGDHFAKKYDAFIVFAGGRQDFYLCERIQALMNSLSVNLAGKFSIIESAAIINRSCLTITNDTGLMHIAQALKKPVTAIFGPTVKELGFFPDPENSFILEKNISCRPCSHTGLNRCPKKHFRCMTEITADEVITASEQLYQSSKILSEKHHE